jgi:phenylalanyl-tRNA synthetase alpha chain
VGRIHPLSQIQYEVEDIFINMGFQIMEGPEVELDEYNFGKLNFTDDHPARDMQDTFWTEEGFLLRTHTSSVQVRAMEVLKPPFKIIVPGRVFRYEETDASHENTFYQLEGMMVDKNVSTANLIYIMKTFLSTFFEKDVTVRLRPGYFPFVEPGFELDIQCLICSGKGCQVCKYSGWVELLPCGLIHPNVLKAGGIDPQIWTGFAFGMGLSRLVMMRHSIEDIRHFLSGNIRFLEQF